MDDVKIHVKMKISALWVSLMLCYIYGDYFGLYKPGMLQAMLEGRIPPLGPVTQGVLVGTSLMMTVPALMVFLSLVLPPVVNRWSNIVLGTVYTIIMVITMPGAWLFYLFLGVVEIVLSLSIVWYAWSWPRHETTTAEGSEA
ncbi:MAG TPA: DUF6326 family protein [Thermoanaerobaculia bacterium]|nr:DUF6326 family protein [Thermoanaerobaculia bacterium]